MKNLFKRHKKTENLIELTMVLRAGLTWSQYETLPQQAKNFIQSGSFEVSKTFDR